MTIPRNRAEGRGGFLTRLGLMAAAAWIGLLADAACASPEGEQIVVGDVTFIRDGDYTIIQASDGSIINYISFDILPWETVQFIQPDALSRVLNRITGPDPTVIAGQLLSNGQVYIVNPAGVFFTNGAVVDVGGIYAAAGNLSNDNFLAGKDKFTGLSGDVVNEGLITGDQIHLIGEHVANHGALIADHGVITMLAGDRVYIKQHGEKITVKVDGHTLTGRNRPLNGSSNPSMTATPGVINTGTIQADRGQVVLGAGDLYSLAVHNTGDILAAKGDITVAAADGLVYNEGLISASAEHGRAGTVTVQGPSVVNAGTIEANSEHGRAGSVEVTSRNHTYLLDGSVISAAGGDGNARGGEVLVHSYDGLTAMAGGALIDVSGGDDGGRGGFAEVSGDRLLFNGYADLDARSGYRRGTLLLDPRNIIITETGGNDDFLNDDIIEFNEGGMIDAYIAASTLEAIVGDIILEAQGSIYFGQFGDTFTIDLSAHNNNLICRANQTITIRVPIIGANNVTLHADWDGDHYGWVSINVPWEILGNAEFTGEAIVLLGHWLTSHGYQVYNGRVQVGTDYVITGPEITFNGTINSFFEHDGLYHSLRLNGPTTFNEEVGNEYELTWLEVNGPANLNGGLIRTFGRQDYFGPVTLGADTLLQSLDGELVRFRDTVDGAHSLHIETAGLTRFDGEVGGQQMLSFLWTDDPGQTRLGADVNADGVCLCDAVSLADDVIVNAPWYAWFDSTIDGNGHDLIVNSPETTFNGAVSDVDLLRTDAAGWTYIGADISGNKLDFNDSVWLYRDAVLTGDDWIDFDDTLDGEQHLTLIAGEYLRFGGDVGGMAALKSLTTDVGDENDVGHNLVIIDGELIEVIGDITFNADGREVPAWVATIAARADELTIRSLNGDIFMGRNEKITSLGDLRLEALNGEMTLGDLNAYGDLDVISPDIALWGREAGVLLDENGNFIFDQGADVVAGGSIFFSSTPGVIGGGANPIFATSSGRGVNSALRGFELLSFGELTRGRMLFGDTVLDLTPTRGTSNLAEALDRPAARIKDRVYLDPFALRSMERLAIYLRGLRDSELLAVVEGRELYNDTARRAGMSAADRGTAVNRLRRASVLDAIDRYTGLFIREEIDEETGEVIMQEDQSEHIRNTLAAAWDAYAAQAEGEAQLSATGFRAYLETAPEHAEAMAYLDGLRGLFSELRAMGASPLELRTSMDAVLEPITPEAMSEVGLEGAVGAPQLG